MFIEKILPSIIAALLPFLFTFFNKKNKNNVRRNVLDEAQRRVDFINSYFEAQTKVSPNTEANTLKSQLAVELSDIKNNISELYKKEDASDYEKLGFIQIVFLTFKPATITGWIWHIAFYLNFILFLFMALGVSIDEKGEATMAQLVKGIQDSSSLAVMLFLLLPLILFERLAIGNFKKNHLPKVQ